MAIRVLHVAAVCPLRGRHTRGGMVDFLSVSSVISVFQTLFLGPHRCAQNMSINVH
jgi:hypothetical protein